MLDGLLFSGHGVWNGRHIDWKICICPSPKLIYYKTAKLPAVFFEYLKKKRPPETESKICVSEISCTHPFDQLRWLPDWRGSKQLFPGYQVGPGSSEPLSVFLEVFFGAITGFASGKGQAVLDLHPVPKEQSDLGERDSSNPPCVTCNKIFVKLTLPVFIWKLYDTLSWTDCSLQLLGLWLQTRHKCMERLYHFCYHNIN